MAVTADELGFDSVWVQDHVSRSPEDAEHHFAVGAWEAWKGPVIPNVYEALATLAYIAGLTRRIRLGTSALVVPLRNPVWLAKEVASLDRLSQGRVTLGVAPGGAYVRQELAAIGRPELAARRGRVVDEWVDIVRGIWREHRYTYRGKFIEVADAEVFPKPLQRPLPIWIGGTSQWAKQRVARRGDGWLAIWLTAEELRRGRSEIHAMIAAANRDPSGISISTEHWLAIDHDASRAAQRSRATRTRFSQHISALPTASDDNVAGLANREDEYSLVGNPERVLAQLGQYRDAGADLVIIRVIGQTLEEVLESLHLFREEVMTRL